MVIVLHELVSPYESNFLIFSIHSMNQFLFLFHMDDTHHMNTNICETIVKIIVFDEKNHVKNYFLVSSHRFIRNFLFSFDYRPICIYVCVCVYIYNLIYCMANAYQVKQFKPHKQHNNRVHKAHKQLNELNCIHVLNYSVITAPKKIQ